MSILRNSWMRFGVAFYFSATILLSSLAIFSTTDEVSPAYNSDPLVIGICLMIFFFGLYIYLLNCNRTKDYIRRYILLSLLIILSILGVGIFLYTDYLRSAFHAICGLYLILLYKQDFFRQMTINKDRMKFLLYLTLFISIAGLGWIILYGYYGIILRAPGAKNWILFNLYSLGYLFIGLDAVFFMKSKLNTQVRITPDSLFIDDNDYTQLLGQKDIQVLRLFVQNNQYKTSCSIISKELLLDKNENGTTKLIDCKTCIREKQKATLCPNYKRIYNQILKIKKFLETMGIGTILSPQNKMNITREGWILRIFENIRINFHF